VVGPSLLVQADPKLTVGEVPVAVQATANFTNSQTGATETVTLKPSTTVLQQSSSSVLRAGDKAPLVPSASGNQVMVNATLTGKLTST
jgi:hypothetical protein